MTRALLVLLCVIPAACGRYRPLPEPKPITPPVIIDPGIPLPPSEVTLTLPELARDFGRHVGRTVYLRGVERVDQEAGVPGGYRLTAGALSLNAQDSPQAQALFQAMPGLLGAEITVTPHEVSGELPPRWLEVLAFRPEGSFQRTLSVAELEHRLAAYKGRSVTVTGVLDMQADHWPDRHFRLGDRQGHALPANLDNATQRLFQYFASGAITAADVTGQVQDGRLTVLRYRTHRR